MERNRERFLTTKQIERLIDSTNQADFYRTVMHKKPYIAKSKPSGIDTLYPPDRVPIKFLDDLTT